jgi:aminoglycoside phosphotransferase (APT) family kinase protein
VLGAPFYLMSEVDGVVLRSEADYAAVPAGAGARIAAALVDVLTELHAVDPAAVGLGDFGKPDGYLGRQLRTWERQWEASRTRELPEVTAVLARLGAALPTARRAAIVHGDYRLDNVIVDRTYERVLAVLDWEMATLGDPMTDVGMLYVYTDLADRGLSLVTPTPDPRIGLPGAREMVDRYGENVDVDGLEWYVALGYLKLAIIAEGIHARYLQGKTVGAGFDRMGAAVPMLIDLALGTSDA